MSPSRTIAVNAIASARRPVALECQATSSHPSGGPYGPASVPNSTLSGHCSSQPRSVPASECAERKKVWLLKSAYTLGLPIR